LTGLLHLFSHLPADVEPVLLTSFDPHKYIEMPAGLIHRQVSAPKRPPHPGNWLSGLMQYYRYIVRPWQQAVSQAIRDYQPDLIHANNSVTINLGAGLAGWRHGIPTISHQKHFEYPERLSRLVLKRTCFAQHIATSDAVGAHMLQFGLSPERCTRIYEPVIGPSDEDLSRRVANEMPAVAMHSMLVRWKGQHVFLPAVAEVRRRCPQPFRVIVAGGPPADDTAYAEELQQQTTSLGLDDIVQFPGHQRNVYEFLATADVAVHAAVEPEPFGRVAAEAMLAGLASIVTIGGGPSEYVRDGVTGLHVPRNDVPAMADAIERLITDPVLRQNLGQAARQYALREFDPQAIADQTVALYRRILSSK
jgi:glycosyltransferase involved in cell wall biosynthesis